MSIFKTRDDTTLAFAPIPKSATKIVVMDSGSGKRITWKTRKGYTSFHIGQCNGAEKVGRLSDLKAGDCRKYVNDIPGWGYQNYTGQDTGKKLSAKKSLESAAKRAGVIDPDSVTVFKIKY